MFRTQQTVQPHLRVTVSQAIQHRALVPLQAAETRRLSLIRGYQAMAFINRDLVRLFTPCEEEAERHLTKYRRNQS